MIAPSPMDIPGSRMDPVPTPHVLSNRDRLHIAPIMYKFSDFDSIPDTNVLRRMNDNMGGRSKNVHQSS